MNQSLSNLWSYVNRHAYPILFILFALWMCIGIFPLVCYETDSQEMILGCDILYEQGWHFPPIYCYEYQMQPLIPITVVALKHLMPFLTCEQIYCLLTAVASFIFLIGCIEFARHIMKENRTKILIAAMLLPEMYAIAMYPNSAILAAAFFIWAFINITEERHWLALLLMSIAPLFRADVVIVYPAILPLLLFEGKSWKKSLILSAIYGMVVVAVVFTLLYVLNADILVPLSQYDYWSNEIWIVEIILAIIGFYSLSYFILLPMGLYRILKQQSWKELSLVLLPIILQHFVYRSNGCAAKHYFYITSFAIIAGVRALTWIYEYLKEKKYVRRIVVVCIVLFYLVSVRIDAPLAPNLKRVITFNEGVVFPFCSMNISNAKISVGLGTGQYVMTADECMFASGHFFYPWCIHSYKKSIKGLQGEMKKTLDLLPSSSNIITYDWGLWGPLLSMYLAEGYYSVFHKEEQYFAITHEGRCLNIWRYHEMGDVDVFFENVRNISKDDEIYVLSPIGIPLHMDKLTQLGKVEQVSEFLYKINKDNLP